MAQWRFAIISDVHVYSTGKVPGSFTTVLAQLAELAPRFVVLGGDATVGNPEDGVPSERVRLWWHSMHDALRPLREAGIPILPIAGNHDYYTPAHRQEYRLAWPQLAADFARVAALSEGGDPPLYYSARVDDVHLSFVHVVDQKIDETVEAWLRRDLAAAADAALRLVIGHVPLVSMMGHTSESFKQKLGSLLAERQVAAYFSGHEHLVWDQVLTFDSGTVRQIHVGTASGTYHYPLNQATYDATCIGDHGTIPLTQTRFALVPGTRQQADKVNICMVELDETSFVVRPMSLREGRLVPFGE